MGGTSDVGAGGRGRPLAVSWTGGNARGVLWTFADESTLSGGPAVAADGSVHVATRGRALVRCLA
ncbi:MAG: hypothetical protein RLZZ387_625 [Chloroflexota bacterium]|jgi:outer membrane protein assembly factor BamB